MYRCPICGQALRSHRDRSRHWRFTGTCRGPINLYAMTCGFRGIQGGPSGPRPPAIVQAAAVGISIMIHLPIALYLLSHLEG